MNVEGVLKTSNKIPIIRRSVLHLMLINNSINEQLTQALKPYDISLQQFNVLMILRGQQGKPANLCTINERMIFKMSNTTRLVDKLLLKGLVNRVICPQNRRKVEISLTKTGEKALSELDRLVDETEKKLTKGLSEKELVVLNQILDKF